MPELTADEMFRVLNRKGFIRLYITFVTGKYTILPESEPMAYVVTHVPDYTLAS
jgi:hypothetical protein